MSNAFKINKPSWFLNPWFDTMALSGLPMGLLVVSAIFYARPHVTDGLIYTLSYFPHILAGLLVFSLTIKEDRKKFIFCTVAAVAIFVGVFILSLTGYGYGVGYFRYNLGRLHICVQSCFILYAFRLLNEDNGFLDRVVDNTVILMALGAQFAAGFKFIHSRFPGLIEHSPGSDFYVDFLKVFPILLWASVFVFALRQIYLFIRLKKFYLFKILLAIAIIEGISLPYIPISNHGQATVFDVPLTLHCMQYIAWVWLYFQYQSAVLSRPEFINHLVKGQGVLFFVFLFGFSFLCNHALNVMRPVHYFLPVIMRAMAYVHFFTDLVIWRELRICDMVRSLKKSSSLKQAAA